MTEKFISLVVSCFMPSKTSIEVAGELSKILISNVEELELIYLWNGLTEKHTGIRNEIKNKLTGQKNCILLNDNLFYQVLLQFFVPRSN